MDELQKLMADIETLRTNLHTLLDEKSNMNDPDIISASQMLNAAITKYIEILAKKRSK